MDIDYNNLEGEVNDVRVLVVSVVGNRICMNVGAPGCDVWFFVSFYYMGYGYVRCVTRDCVSFRPFEWAALNDRSYGGVRFLGDPVGGGEVWAVVGGRARERVEAGSFGWDE